MEDDALFAVIEVIETLTNARKRKKMSQRELSRLSGVPQKTISRLENGVDRPRLDTFAKLVRALDVNLTGLKSRASDIFSNVSS